MTVSAVTSSSATIAWTTNQLSDTQVEYGTTTAYGSLSALNALLLTAHVTVLNGLSAGTLYHYRVRSRNAAGTLSMSADFAFTTTAGGGAIVFESNWPTIGTSTAAVTDGGRWPTWNEYDDDGSGTQLLTVVSGGPSGLNALRVLQRGHDAAHLIKENFIAQSQDYYVRFYMKTDDTSSAGDHIVTVEPFHYANLTFMRKYGGSTTWGFDLSMYGCSQSYPVVHWGPPQRLNNGQWYRFEYFVDFVNATNIRIHPRVYDASGTLIYSDADFQQEDFGSSTWNGRSDWTLASYYAAGHTSCVQPTWMNDFSMGNNGQQGAGNTGRFWYYAGLQIRTDTWPGPAASGADVTPIAAPDPGDVSQLGNQAPANRREEAFPLDVQVELPFTPFPASLTVLGGELRPIQERFEAVSQRLRVPRLKK